MSASKFRMTAACMAAAAGLTLTALTVPVASAAPSAKNATVVSTVPAHTEVLRSYARCGAGNFCLFEHINGTGRAVGLHGARGTLGSLNFDKITSSIRNRNGRIWSVYSGTNFTGRCLSVAATYSGNVTQYGLNDHIRSARPGRCPA
jgi:hypothetical protein